MKGKKYFSIGAMLGLLMFAISTGWTQPVTVNSEGGADYTSISDALAGVASDAREPDVITITGGGPYEEGVPIGSPVTIQGQSADERPIIVLKQVGGNILGEHGLVNTAGVDITLENLIFIPFIDTPPRRAICIEPVADSDNFSLTIRNVLVSANDGQNQPASIDGMENSFTDTTVPFQDDGIWMLASYYRPDGTVHVEIEDTVVTHCDPDRDPTSLSANSDGFVLGGVNASIVMRNVVCSYNDRYGAQVISSDTRTLTPSLLLDGTYEEPIIFKGNGSQGIQLWTADAVWRHVHFIENPQGTRIDISSVALQAESCLFADNKEAVDLDYTPLNADPLTYSFTGCTFFGNETDFMFSPRTEEAATLNLMKALTIEVKDSVIAQTWIYLANSTFEAVPEGYTDFPALVYRNSALVTEGDSLLFIDFEGIPVAPDMIDVINSDPMFLSVEPGNPDYLRVSAAPYETAASDGGKLRGAFLFAGEESVSVLDWLKL